MADVSHCNVRSANARLQTAASDGLGCLFWSRLSLSILEETRITSEDWMYLFKAAMLRKGESK